MNLLLKIAFQNRRHYGLLFFTFISLIGLTIASQLELVSLGIMTDKGVDFFQLFAPIEHSEPIGKQMDRQIMPPEGVLGEVDALTLGEIQERFHLIDNNGNGVITRSECQDFVLSHKGKGWFQWFLSYFHAYFDVAGGLRNLAFFLFFVSIFKGVTLFSQRYTTRLMSIRISRDLRQAYFEHIQSLPMSFYQKFNIGSLSSRIVTDATVTADGINAAIINYLQTPLVVTTSLTLCFISSWRLSLIIFFGLPLILFPILYLSKKIRRVSRDMQQNQEHFASTILDFLSGVQTVKVFAMEDFSLNKYREQNGRLSKYEEKGAKLECAARPIIHMIAQFFLSTAVLYGLYIELMSVSEILVYCGLLYSFYEPIKKFGEENIQIQKGIAAAERMYEVLHIRSEIEDAKDAAALTEFKESITFDRISFRYEEQWVLKDVSFTVKKGQKVAICGPTGAGKSTIAQLLPRLYDVQQGSILIDGKPLSAYTQKSLREMIALVPQKPFLFLDTVAANIAFGRDFSREEIILAAQKAHAAEFITLLPQGYDTPLLEAGKNLSGGQQQRLAIARALIKNSAILVLDEATSALDATSEGLIRDTLSSLRGQVTEIIIAHRFSTIEDADKIIFIDKGEKIAEGTKDELLANCPPFRHMWQLLNGQS